MSLKKELCRFWIWAGITPTEYEQSVPPKNPMAYAGSEWEYEYPNFLILEAEFSKAIKIYQVNSDDSQLVGILEAIAIDSGSEGFMDMIRVNLKPIESFVKLGVKFHLSNTRWQIAELLSNINMPNRGEYLKKMAMKDEHYYVRQRALNSLQKIKSPYLIEACLQNLTSENDTLKVICLRHLMSINFEGMDDIKKQFSNEPSDLIQQELKDLFNSSSELLKKDSKD